MEANNNMEIETEQLVLQTSSDKWAKPIDQPKVDPPSADPLIEDEACHSPSKKKKKNDGSKVPVLKLLEVEEYPTAAMVSTSTVVVLTSYCKRMGLKQSGTKSELIQRILDKINTTKDSNVIVDSPLGIPPQLIRESDLPSVSAVVGSSVSVLKAYCKEMRLIQSGTRPELVKRVLDALSNNGSSTSCSSNDGSSNGVQTKKTATKKNTLSGGTTSTTKKVFEIVKRNRDIPTIEILLNKTINRFVHVETQLVFDDDKVVYGRLSISPPCENGEVVPLTDVDIEQCKKYKFLYRPPTNLANVHTGVDMIEEMEELDFSDDEEPLIEEDDPLADEEEPLVDMEDDF